MEFTARWSAKASLRRSRLGKDWQEVTSGGRAFRARGIPNAKALRQEHGWDVQEIAKIKSS